MQTQASHDMNHPTFHHRPLLLLLLLSLTLLSACASTPIRGTQKADPERMYQYVASRNPDFSREVAQAFYEIGELYGIRGDIALCQAIIETGWFRFDNGTAVSPSAHNYCGLGVKRRGDKGCSFKSVREGVTAMIQHLYARRRGYARPAFLVCHPRLGHFVGGSLGTMGHEQALRTQHTQYI